MDPRTHDPEQVARWVVPVGLGALTWLAATLTAGVLLGLEGLTPLVVVVPLVVGALFLPIYRARPWAPGASERVLAWASERRRALAVAAAIFLLARLPVVSDLLAPVLGILFLPLRALPQVLYGTRMFYDGALGPPAGQVLFGLGRLYLELLWLYVLGTAVAKLFPRGDPAERGEGPPAPGGEP